MLYKCPVCNKEIDLLLYGNVKNFEMTCNCGTKLAYDMQTYQLSIVKSKTDYELLKELIDKTYGKVDKSEYVLNVNNFIVNHLCNGKSMVIELHKVKIGNNNAAAGICPRCNKMFYNLNIN